MADKKKFPNPEFFRAKTEMDWKAQAANLKEFGSIALDLIKETDWKAFGRKQKEHFLDNMNRVAREAKTVAAMTCAERKDLLLNGEKHLGALYRKGDMATVRREWRGVESTLVDFSGWLKVWGMLLATFSKDLIPALNTTFWYRWMISYMCCVSFMDKNTMGQRGNALKMSHLMTYDIFRYVAENLVFLAKCDKKDGNSSELNKKVVLFDEMTMGQIMAGFPDLLGIPYQLMPVFLVSEIDQLTCVPYIDAVESFGLPADCCPVPSSECGALVIDALPHMGKCFISSSMPCDGSTMASSYMSRRFPDLPVFHLCFPVRYEDEETVQMGAEDIRACIKFIEEQTGAKWSWDAYFSAMKRFNEETRYELEKWEVNKTAYPQIIGPSYELFRKWNYEMDGGIDPRVMKTCRKVNDLLMQSYQRRDEAWVGKMRYRGIVWSCPAHYYANFSNWLANCWGINIVLNMDSTMGHNMISTTDPDQALMDLALFSEKGVMRHMAVGGWDNVNSVWEWAKNFNCDMVLMNDNIACKGMLGVHAMMEEQARDLGFHFIFIEHDLEDCRTVPRRDMRKCVNEYMSIVLNEQPLDPTLVDFDDSAAY